MAEAVLFTNIICPILVGREAYLQPLAQLLEQTANGPLRVALIAGEAGIGKTRLTAELKKIAIDRDFEIWQGQCFEAEQALPYAPFLDLVRAFSAIHTSAEIAQAFGPNLAAQTQTAGPLLKLLPELATYLPNLTAPPASEPEQEKRRLFQAFTTFLTQARRNAPLLLMIEDLHWCDEASLELLLHLTRRLSAQPVFAVLTYRVHETPAALQRLLVELDRARITTEMSLRRLNAGQVETMLRAILDQPVHAEFITAIYTLTEGNPFFIEEIIKSLLVSGELSTRTHEWTADLPIPRTVQEAVTRHFQGVSIAARVALNQAAILGQRFEFALLQKLTGTSEAALLAHLKELISAQLVVEESAEAFAFRHALTRQAVYAALLARERKALHFQAAKLIEQLYAPAAEPRMGELAYHYFEAEVWGKALGYAQRAGEQAIKLYSPRAAVEHFTRALKAAHTLQAPLPLPPLYRARGQAYATLGEFEAARTDYEQAWQTAQTKNDQAEAWQSILALGFHWVQRDMARAGKYFQQALTLAQGMNDPATLAHSLNRLGNWHMMAEQPLEARHSHQQALEIFQSIRHQTGLAETFDLLGITSLSAGDFVGGAAAYEHAIALFRDLANQTGLTSALTMLALCCAQYLSNQAYVSERNRQPECIAHAEEALRLARQIEWRSAEALVLTVLGQALSANGEYGRALSSMQAGLALAQLIEHQQWQLNAHLVLGALHLDLLEAATARQHLETALQLAEELGSLYWKRTVVGFLASTLVFAGQLREAAVLLEAALPNEASFITMGERHSWAAQIELSLAQNQPERAQHILEQLQAALPNAPLLRIPRLARLQGAVFLALGRTTEAEAALQAALAAAQEQGALQWQWRTHAAYAQLHITQRRWAEAEAETIAGKKIVEICAASLANGSLRQNYLSRAAEQFPPLPSTSARQKAKQQFGGLTTREREIAGLLAQGKTNRAIAEALVVSERTVEKHLENIMDKLSFETRVQVAAWALERGLGA